MCGPSGDSFSNPFISSSPLVLTFNSTTNESVVWRFPSLFGDRYPNSLHCLNLIICKNHQTYHTHQKQRLITHIKNKDKGSISKTDILSRLQRTIIYVNILNLSQSISIVNLYSLKTSNLESCSKFTIVIFLTELNCLAIAHIKFHTRCLFFPLLQVFVRFTLKVIIILFKCFPKVKKIKIRMCSVGTILL